MRLWSNLELHKSSSGSVAAGVTLLFVELSYGVVLLVVLEASNVLIMWFKFF